MLPLFSLRSPHDWGVGEIADLPGVARWAAAAGFSLVQLLPFHEIWSGEASPYSAVTAFALDPVFLSYRDLEDFQVVPAHERAASEPLLADLEARLAALRALPAVAWQQVRACKAAAARVAFARFEREEIATGSARARAFDDFVLARAAWLDDYALYWALASVHGPAWWDWPAPLARREPAALAAARATHARAIRFRSYLEWQLDLQWRAARAGARAHGVELAGDLPFLTARAACDVWSHPDLFCPGLRLGVPPDAFSDEGQDWGLPVFDWRRMVRTRFAWMRARAARAGTLCGLWRVDHVLGLYRSYYRRDDGGPAGFTPAREAQQRWLGPRALAALSAAGELVAEDLGPVPDWVRASMTAHGYPGYRVQRWEKDGARFRDPATWPALSVATTGTHDTEALADWYDALPDDERAALHALPGLADVPGRPRFDDGVRDALLRLVYEAGSALTIVPLPDLLGLRARINVPGTVNATNWTWRLGDTVAALAADGAQLARLRSLALNSGRLRADPAR